VKVAVETLAFLLHISEVVGSDLDQEAVYPESSLNLVFFSSSTQMPRQCTKQAKASSFQTILNVLYFEFYTPGVNLNCFMMHSYYAFYR
jgi:hypothetical protein